MKEIKNKIDNVLNSYDNTVYPKVNPFLETRIKEGLIDNTENNFVVGFLWKKKIQFGIVACLFLFNAFTFLQTQKDTIIAPNQEYKIEDAFANEYSISSSNNY